MLTKKIHHLPDSQFPCVNHTLAPWYFPTPTSAIPNTVFIGLWEPGADA